MKAKRASDREWLSDREVNAFLKRAQKTPRFKELAVERICQVILKKKLGDVSLAPGGVNVLGVQDHFLQ